MTETLYLPPEGPLTATLAIVAERAGPNEAQLVLDGKPGRPLIGSSGHEVDRHLASIGTTRGQTYLTNAVKRFHVDYVDGRLHVPTPTQDEIIAEQVDLFRELTALPNLNCIVAMGRIALMSLSNFWYDDILRRRGSVVQTWWGAKMVPTLHPAFYLRGEYRYKPVVAFDLKRALGESQTPEINYPAREFLIEPTFDEAIQELTRLKSCKTISYDIEIIARRHLACLAFSDDPSRAACIPLMKTGGNRHYWPDPWQEMQIWRAMADLFDTPDIEWVTQNGLFDAWWVWKYGLSIRSSKGFDTMYSHILLAPDLPHRLDFITSIYTQECYYKDESGRWDTSSPGIPDRQFWVYNAKDASVTLECALSMKQDMEEYK